MLKIVKKATVSEKSEKKDFFFSFSQICVRSGKFGILKDKIGEILVKFTIKSFSFYSFTYFFFYFYFYLIDPKYKRIRMGSKGYQEPIPSICEVYRVAYFSLETDGRTSLVQPCMQKDKSSSQR